MQLLRLLCKSIDITLQIFLADVYRIITGGCKTWARTAKGITILDGFMQN